MTKKIEGGIVVLDDNKLFNIIGEATDVTTRDAIMATRRIMQNIQTMDQAAANNDMITVEHEVASIGTVLMEQHFPVDTVAKAMDFLDQEAGEIGKSSKDTWAAMAHALGSGAAISSGGRG